MDSQIIGTGRYLDIVDDTWREERLPFEDIQVPADELPDPETDTGESPLTLKEQEQSWSDLALTNLNDQHNN
ncbi:anaphase-promoting complex subunit 13-like [Ctenocephalides felis]|uniref:anaphase-promoting complex subunit 13-like n=1 Tax=Ctenocephalides felis TaxID=7515 RepID=UPI000E6E350C|nr:anaphase-promoting complex subunit 13-like [Ctenocephalides felis]XP_026478524.1 anaphase-promoting complex subunit 13-like [Ctenocephalides felis]